MRLAVCICDVISKADIVATVQKYVTSPFFLLFIAKELTNTLCLAELKFVSENKVLLRYEY